MTLGRDLSTSLGLNLNFSDHVIKSYDVPLRGSSAPMVDLVTYEFKDSNVRKITPEYLFMNDYAKKHESEQVHTSIKKLYQCKLLTHQTFSNRK